MPLSVQYCIKGTIMFALGGDFAEGNMVISAFIDNQFSFTTCTKEIFFVALIFQVKYTFSSSKFQAGAFKANCRELWDTPSPQIQTFFLWLFFATFKLRMNCFYGLGKWELGICKVAMENKQTATKGTKSWQQFEINLKRARRMKKEIKIKEAVKKVVYKKD